MSPSAFPLLPLLLAASLQAHSGDAPAQAPPRHPVTAGPLASSELVAAITAQDRRLFTLVFDHCDMTALGGLLSDDFQMLHDKGGLIPTRAAFLEGIQKTWEGRATGQNVQARREVVPGSEAIYAMSGDRALHTGLHRFYGLTPGKPDQLRETGRFFHEYRLEKGSWKLARVYSYDHRPAE